MTPDEFENLFHHTVAATYNNIAANVTKLIRKMFTIYTLEDNVII